MGDGRWSWEVYWLIQGFAAHDTWNALIGHIARQYPEAFMSAALIDEGSSVPNNSLRVESRDATS